MRVVGPGGEADRRLHLLFTMIQKDDMVAPNATMRQASK